LPDSGSIFSKNVNHNKEHMVTL